MCDGLKLGRRVENVANVEKMQKIEKNQKKLLTFPQICIILTYVIEAWLSLVERCVRDAEVASSNLVASTHFSLCLKKWPHGQAVKTTPSHGVNSGSIPDEVICFGCKSKAFLLGRFCSAVGSATHS